MRRRRRQFASLAAGLYLTALAGCAEVPALPSLSQLLPSIPAIPSLQALAEAFVFDDQVCAQVSEDDVKRVNWTRVPEVNMRIRADEFEPMIIQMKQGWPYIFRIRNRDDAAHVFASRDFFTNMAIIRLTVDGDRRDDT